MNNKLAQDLSDAIAQIPVINSHSHMWPEQKRLETEADALVFFDHPYPRADLITAGMSMAEVRRALSPGLPWAERWCIFARYWPAIRFTGYSQSILIAFRDLFGVSALTAATVEPLSDALRRSAVPGFYKEILQDRCGIETSVMQMEDLVEVDPELFLPMPRLNRFTMVESLDQLQAIERDYNASIGSLGDYLELVRRVCADWKRTRVAGVKLSQSYHRRMDFVERDDSLARQAFEKLLRGAHQGLESPDGRLLEDYLVFEGCRAASEQGLTIQFHLGLRAGNWGSLEGSSAAPMVPLMRAFPQARFDLSHSGYPYLHESTVLAKTFPNLYLDLSWIHIVSPVGVREALREWLRAVPYTKIIAFGDDVYHPEMVYGHLRVAQDNVAVVLAETIEEGVMTEEQAMDVAHALFYDNPKALYLETH